MLKKACPVCKVVGVFAIIGALNWGAVVFLNVNVVNKLLSPLHLARVAYALVTLSGLALLASYFTVCPKCKK